MAAAKSAWVIDVAEASFDREVIERSRDRPVVVDFWAPWCGPCQMLGPVLEKLISEKSGEVILAKVNIDEAQELAARYAVEAIPAVKAFRDGKPVLEFVGLLPESQLRAFVDRLSPTEADRLARQAGESESTQPAEAETLYRRAIELDRNHEGALVGVARLLLARGQFGEVEDLLARVVPGGEQGTEAERLGAVLFLRQQAQEFGTESSARQRLEAEPDNPQVRYELGCILAASGQSDKALELLLAAAERDRSLARSKVREVMVKVFQTIGVRSSMADEYRDKLARLLY